MTTMKKKAITNKLEEYAQPKYYGFLIILFCFGVFIQLLIQVVYWAGKIWILIPTDFSTGEVLTYWGSFFSFIGTFALGALALSQNKHLNEINEQPYLPEQKNNKKIIYGYTCVHGYVSSQIWVSTIILKGIPSICQFFLFDFTSDVNIIF